MEESTNGEDLGVGRTRSPAYPGIDLKKAIAYAKQLYGHAKLHEVNKSAVGKAWGMSPTGGHFLGNIAALRSFGLVERRKYRLTKDAERIIVDPTDSDEKREAIRRAALSPKIYLELWNKYGTDGVDGGIEENVLFSYLVLDRPEPRYAESAAKLVIRYYKSTLSFAGIQGAQQVPDDDNEVDPTSEGDDRDLKEPLKTDNDPPQPERQSMQGEQEIVRGTFSPDSGFRLMLRGEDRTPRHFKLMIAQIILHADYFAYSTRITSGSQTLRS